MRVAIGKRSTNTQITCSAYSSTIKKSNPIMQIQHSKQGGIYNHEFDLHDTDNDVIISIKIHMSIKMVMVVGKCKIPLY